jgi:hypothetical protein
MLAISEIELRRIKNVTAIGINAFARKSKESEGLNAIAAEIPSVTTNATRIKQGRLKTIFRFPFRTLYINQASRALAASIRGRRSSAVPGGINSHGLMRILETKNETAKIGCNNPKTIPRATIELKSKYSQPIRVIKQVVIPRKKGIITHGLTTSPSGSFRARSTAHQDKNATTVKSASEG